MEPWKTHSWWAETQYPSWNPEDQQRSMQEADVNNPAWGDCLCVSPLSFLPVYLNTSHHPRLSLDQSFFMFLFVCHLICDRFVLFGCFVFVLYASGWNWTFGISWFYASASLLLLYLGPGGKHSRVSLWLIDFHSIFHIWLKNQPPIDFVLSTVHNLTLNLSLKSWNIHPPPHTHTHTPNS